MIVYALTTRTGALSSLHTTAELANAARDRLNADPWIESGNPDLDAPYRVGPWVVHSRDMRACTSCGDCRGRCSPDRCVPAENE